RRLQPAANLEMAFRSEDGTLLPGNRLSAPMTTKPRARLTPAAMAVEVGRITGHEFADPERLERALTHASARAKGGSDYERLEFLGDRVLGLVVAELLFREFPTAREGELSVRLNQLVNAE